jgi:hypothetical protein
MQSIIRPVGSQATVTPPQSESMLSDGAGIEVDDLTIVKNASHEVIYEYPTSTGDTDREFRDGESLAKRDSLAVDHGSYDPDKPGIVNDDRVRRRRSLLMIACCILLGIVVLTTILTTKNNSSIDKDVTNSVEDVETEEVVSHEPSTAPVAQTLAPVTLSVSKSVLESVVSNPAALEDPTSPEGQAFSVVSSEDLDNPNDIVTRYSLLTAFFATGGEGWTNNDGWATHSTNHCGWHGNTCDSPGILTQTVLSE